MTGARPRKLALTLTEDQYLALAGAVAEQDEMLKEFGGRDVAGRRRALNNGWGRIWAAWNGEEP